MAAIDFNQTFGKNAAPAASAAKADRPKAQLWLNVGYGSGVMDEEGNEKFVSLPIGIPVDTMEKVPANSRNKDFAKFSAARNDLLEQIIAAGMSLEAGESSILNLQIQLRRVNEEQADVGTDGNEYARKLEL